jgi:hypothetical protein
VEEPRVVKQDGAAMMISQAAAHRVF